MTEKKKIEKKKIEKTNKEEENLKEETILFAEDKVGDIIIKPWSFGVLFDITDDIENVINKIEENNIDIEKLFEQGISWKTMVKIFSIASPHILNIICLTTGQKKEVIRDLPLTDGVKIAFKIYLQNREQIKNVFGPQE